MQQTTTAELFFDLVYVFAVTQLSVQELLYALVNEVPAPTPVEPFAFLVDVCSRVLSPRWSRRRSRSRARRFSGARGSRTGGPCGRLRARWNDVRLPARCAGRR